MVDALGFSAWITGSGVDPDPITRMTLKVPDVAGRLVLAGSLSRASSLRSGVRFVVSAATGQWDGKVAAR